MNLNNVAFFALPSCLVLSFSFFFLIGPHQYVKHQLLTVLSCSVVPLQWVWHLLSHNTAVHRLWPLLCCTVSSFFFSNLFWQTLSLPLSFCPPPPHLPRSSRGVLMQLCFPTVWAHSQLGSSKEWRGKSTQKHSLQKQVEECRTNILIAKTFLKTM